MKTVSTHAQSIRKMVRFMMTIILSVLIVHLFAPKASAADVTLQWDANADADYYVVYYGTASGTYTQSTAQIAATQTQTTISGLADTTWYFSVKAFTNSGNSSDYSDEITYTPPVYSPLSISIDSPGPFASITEGDSINFQASVSGGVAPLTYSWSFGIGGPASSSVEDPGAVVFSNPGMYTVTLTVTDANGSTVSASSIITVTQIYINSIPTAQISSPLSAQTITAGGSVNFQGTVLNGNPPFTYSWNFGTNGPSGQSVEDPGNVTFPTAGNYTVTFTVTDNDKEVSTATMLVTVTAPYVNLTPTAVITSPASSVAITAGGTVNFQGSVNSGNAPFTYAWSFGTGGPANSAVQNPGNVTFPTAGTYAVTYTVTDNDSQRSSASVLVTVNAPYVNLTPTASITSPASNVTITTGASVNFQGTVISGNAPIVHSWTFGTGGPASKSVEDPGNVAFPTAGTYTVTYTATDKDNDSSSASVVVTVKDPYVNVQPTAAISSPNGNVSITEGASVNFQATVTSGNAPFTHSWVFGNGGPASKTVEDPGNVTFPTAGIYAVTYTVTDNDGDKSSATVTVTVTKPYVNVIPTAFMTSPISDVTITEGASVNFQGSVTSGNAPFTYAWDFGTNGPSSQTVENPGNVTFPKAGTYTVTYTVTDNDGDKSNATVTVTVLAPVTISIPMASIASPATDIAITQGQNVNFQGSVKDGAAPFTYAWDFSDSGVPAMTVVNPGSVTFATAGTYKVTFKVIDGNKNTSSAAVTVTVNGTTPVVTVAPAPVAPVNQTQVSLTPELVSNTAVTTGDTQWQISTTPTFSDIVMDVTQKSGGNSMKVPALVLNGQSTYYWRIKNKTSKGVSDWSAPTSFITEPETWNDANGNGIPDNQEVTSDTDLNNDGISDITQPDVIKLVKSYNGKGVIGIAKLSNVKDIELLDAMDDSTISDTTNKPGSMPLNLIGFRIVTQNPGDKVMIGIYLSEPAPAGAGWFKYDSVYGWQNYSTHAVFSQDRKMITVELTDGGDGDADGSANGVIVDPAGIGMVATSATTAAATSANAGASGSGGKGCFITSTDDACGQGLGFTLILLIVGIALIRPSDKSSVK